jgi:hypothetical protein
VQAAISNALFYIVSHQCPTLRLLLGLCNNHWSQGSQPPAPVPSPRTSTSRSDSLWPSTTVHTSDSTVFSGLFQSSLTTVPAGCLRGPAHKTDENPIRLYELCPVVRGVDERLRFDSHCRYSSAALMGEEPGLYANHRCCSLYSERNGLSFASIHKQ